MAVISDNHDVTIGNKYVIDKNMIVLELSVCNIFLGNISNLFKFYKNNCAIYNVSNTPRCRYAIHSSPTLYYNIYSSVLSHIYCFYIICNVMGGISINKGIKDDNDGEMSLL